MTSLRVILTELFAHDRRMALAGVVLGAVTVLAGMALLGLSGWFISATAIAGLSMATAVVFDVFSPSAGIRLLALGRTFGRYGERLTTHDATLGMVARLREKLFRGWATPQAARHLLMRPARLLFRLTADAEALEAVYLRLLVPLVAASCAVVVASVALGLVSVWLGLFVFGTLAGVGAGALVVCYRYAVKPARRLGHALEALRARVIDLVAGQSELAMRGELANQAVKVMAAQHRLVAAENALQAQEARVGAVFTFASSVLLAGVLLGVAALHSQGGVSVPVAALAVLVVLAAFEPFAALRRGVVELGRTLVAVRRLAPRLEGGVVSPPSPRPSPPRGRGGVPPCPDDDIRVEHASVAGRLRDVSLVVKAGEKVALVGASGAGKSSLLALLAGEVDAEAGGIKVGECCLMTQNSELFQDTLRRNLQLADPSADDSGLWEALGQAGLAVDLRNSQRGLDTLLGEGGLGLSQGQARRLALARLILRGAPVWLLDEPTESVDAATANDILNRLAALVTGRTLIVATHMRREAELCDRIITLEGGRIMDEAMRGSGGFDAALAMLKND
jgi:ATP-binding cassette, subfamily C, bacterial CydC